ncbi:hypothetical protein EDB92DRAFT_1864947 [Lactarius akahatsu]|uniref:Uncharacterized protein n=1 Tax=Lactarius akahatsu TaxID=416441 RepID=A0AAD4LIR4_9AGAM|nr:hypothetical protein EDB92DRAFT_1864947 [Lactarius akahatsu]
MILVHDNDLAKLHGINDGTPVEYLQDTMLSLLRGAELKIHEIPFGPDLLSVDNGRNVDTEIVWVATLSNLFEELSPPSTSPSPSRYHVKAPLPRVERSPPHVPLKGSRTLFRSSKSGDNSATSKHRASTSPNWRMYLISGERERQQQENPEGDHSWEDVSDDEPNRLSNMPSTSSTPSNSFRSARRRTAVVSSPRHYVRGDSRIPARPQARARSFTAGPPPQPAAIPGPGPGTLALDTLRYVSDILGTVLRTLKTPIYFVLVIFACTYAISIASGATRTALAPICSIPIVSLVCPTFQPYPTSPSNHVLRRADVPRLLDVESKILEPLLEETAEGSGLALEIQKAEIATSDLVTLVRVSDLNGRDVLVDSLSDFVKDARRVGRGLTRFSSQVDAVDNIIAMNDHALRVIEAAGSEDRLVLEAEVSISDLNKLEEHLTSIHEIVSREDGSISAARREHLAQLSTVLGDNREEINKMDEDRALLKSIDRYRDRALAHVVAALHMLETMAEEMETLRERMAVPQLVGETIPIHVHMRSLRSGMEGLKGRRDKLMQEMVKRIMPGD